MGQTTVDVLMHFSLIYCKVNKCYPCTVNPLLLIKHQSTVKLPPAVSLLPFASKESTIIITI